MIVSKETRDALKALGRKGETYDAILVRLLDHYAKTSPMSWSEMEREITDIETDPDLQEPPWEPGELEPDEEEPEEAEG